MEKNNMNDITSKIKNDSVRVAALSEDVRNLALKQICESLLQNKEKIVAANGEDLKKAQESGLPQPIIKRLLFDEAKLNETIEGIKGLINLPDPLFKTLLKRRLDKDLILEKISCPIGVIGVIFESRPDALVQIATLCLKSGNCSILKGGSEAANTNRILYEIIYQAGLSAGVPSGFLTLLESRSDIDALLKCDKDIDLLIPRGSNEFVKYIMDNSKIPVMGHADGICHVYADKSLDLNKAIQIIVDSKTQYVAACNAAETLLVHKDAADSLLPPLKQAFDLNGVELRGCDLTRQIIDCKTASLEDFETEYLDNILSIKIVDSLKEAIEHINYYGSHHTDSIITQDEKAASDFMLLVDSAGVYHNCSTRFADGFRYGFGAEVGISTGKLHARGPVGLDGLVTYKYRLSGKGHIVADYSSGKCSFNFKDL
ncbi:MAG: glutamate-5-semialdehyde dehydrogenase [Anaerovoracaceae bacterium]|jgi:glutamate-5-semialdehyde dehydrogenase